MKTITDQNEFRGDIEFLRGIAVLLVVAFHLKLSLIGSGFIGVDIFFVISGYLMAAAFNGSRSLGILNFYSRRARRVLPASLIVFLLFFISSPLVFLPFETKIISESFIGNLLLVPNLVFWSENTYFDEFSFRPMLHYWSLGVEFQYYVTFPILLLLVKSRQWVLGLLLIGSFIASIILTHLSAKTAFFMLPTRIWEFLAGYFAFIYVQRYGTIKVIHSNKLSLLILCSIVLTSCVTIPQEKFPGIYALTPVILTFFYLIIGLEHTSSMLWGGGGIIRYLGKISFSIYLLHFPIIFYFIYAPFSEWKILSGEKAFLALALTIFLSAVLYHLVEVPLRKRIIFSKIKFEYALSLLLIISIGTYAIFHFNNYFSSAYSKAQQNIFYAMNDRADWLCSPLASAKELKSKTCTLHQTPSSNKNILLIGDSHMDAIKMIFVESAKTHSNNIHIIKESCILGVASCSTIEVLKMIESHHITDLVLHGYNPSRFDFHELQNLIDSTRNTSVSLHFIGPVPTYSSSVPKLLYQSTIDRGALFPLHKKSDLLSKINKSYDELKKRNLIENNVKFYDPMDYLCDTYCNVQGDSGVYYHDSHHLTLTGARALLPIAEIVNTNAISLNH